jgi:glutamate-ammonia-ligase adenylyltransferase
LINHLPDVESDFKSENYLGIFLSGVKEATDFAHQIAVLRKIWSRFLLDIVTFDVFEKITLTEAKRAQTRLAEASVETAIFITKNELENRFSIDLEKFPFAVLALGKLGGKGVDYGSDLDLVLVYDDTENLPVKNLTHAEYYSKAVEIFVNSLSAVTREGHLYRVDLRLRPDGKNGATSIGKTAFFEYLKNRSAIWEWLAYVKIRGVAGEMDLADSVGREARNIIHENALEFQKSDENAQKLKTETIRIRENLEKQKSVSRRKTKEIDIKFGEGGMLDVYFAARFLQLRDNLPDSGENRSTVFTLEKLFENDSINAEDYKNFSDGYKFLSELDHNLRLTVGRSTRLPLANRKALETINKRMKTASIENLLEQLTFHRLNIRASFENILKSRL